MAMDWSGYGSYAAQPMEEVEDDEDFYTSEQDHMNGNNHTHTAAGAASNIVQSPANLPADFSAMQSNNIPTTPTNEEEQRKHDQQKQLDILRKKLLAKRGASARPDTPQKTPANLNTQTPHHRMEQQEHNTAANGANQHVNDDFGIESLLAEGKAAAEAKTIRDNQAAAAAIAATMNPSPFTITQPSPAATAPSNMEVEEVKPENTRQKPADPTQSVVSSPQKAADPKQSNAVSNAHPVNMSDPYYDDLSVWLEFTGYHDVQFRNAKLSTYKQRLELEQEAARIAQKLEALKQAERADLESLRATTAHQNTATQMAPPPLPSHMPTGDYRNHANGLKRPHSPEPSTAEKASRKSDESASDFRIRGANDASAASSATLSHENGSSVHRRDSLSERRRSINERHERDPSLERRQQYYGSRVAPPVRANGLGGYSQWATSREGPPPFNARERERERDRNGRSDFSSVNRITRGNGTAHGPSAGLDLRKGGVRYFMIKSWNHDNVVQAMKDGVWATQEKNQSLLTEAFHTSRHVILLFSVNRSMAFQGYALMTSPPDPFLPKPTFCSKLNWTTSPAFSLHWLATTSVHFRLVGHLKNTCNPDDEGTPRAVLVGKDGQEVSQEAGMGVVWILDEADDVEGRGRLREERE
ncbi:hypothetical protein MBLNU13_g11678t2 [Cladosporium sp. NU13]